MVKQETNVCYQDNDKATKAKTQTLANNTISFLCPIHLVSHVPVHPCCCGYNHRFKDGQTPITM